MATNLPLKTSFLKLPDPVGLPDDLGYTSDFSPANQFLAVGYNSSPYLIIYKRSADTFTRIADPADLPSDAVKSCKFSRDGRYLAIAFNSDPYFIVYRIVGDTFTKMDGGIFNFNAGVYSILESGGFTSTIVNYKEEFLVFGGQVTRAGVGSWDGTDWKTYNGHGSGTGPYNSDPLLVAGPIYSSIVYRDFLVVAGTNGYLSSWDGSNWKYRDGTGAGTGPYEGGLVGGNTIRSMTVYNDFLICGMEVGYTNSFDGRNWKYWDGSGTGTGPYSGAGPMISDIKAMTQYGNYLILCGANGKVASWDGTNWKNTDGSGAGTGPYNNGTAVGNSEIMTCDVYNGFLVIASWHGRVASWDGTNWKNYDGSGTGTGPYNDASAVDYSSIYSSIVYRDHLVFGAGTSLVASFDGTNWKNYDGSGSGTGPYSDGTYTSLGSRYLGVYDGYLIGSYAATTSWNGEMWVRGSFWDAGNRRNDVIAGPGTGVSFNEDSDYLGVSSSTTPYINMFRVGGNNFCRTATDPVALPAGIGMNCGFSLDGTYLAVAHQVSPYITIYKRAGDIFTKLADPGDLPADIASGVAFNSDGTYLAVTHYSSPYLIIYKRSGDVFTKLDGPDDMPAGDAFGCSFNFVIADDKDYLAIGHDSGSYITVYIRDGDTFTKLQDPTGLPTDYAVHVAVGDRSDYLAAVHNLAPFLSIYKGFLSAYPKFVWEGKPSSPPGNVKRGDYLKSDKSKEVVKNTDYMDDNLESCINEKSNVFTTFDTSLFQTYNSDEKVSLDTSINDTRYSSRKGTEYATHCTSQLAAEYASRYATQYVTRYGSYASGCNGGQPGHGSCGALNASIHATRYATVYATDYSGHYAAHYITDKDSYYDNEYNNKNNTENVSDHSSENVSKHNSVQASYEP